MIPKNISKNLNDNSSLNKDLEEAKSPLRKNKTNKVTPILNKRTSHGPLTKLASGDTLIVPKHKSML